jgi:hypothetical protein
MVHFFLRRLSTVTCQSFKVAGAIRLEAADLQFAFAAAFAQRAPSMKERNAT